MPAPKRPNTAAATQAAAASAHRRKLKAAAKLIRDAGGTAHLPGDQDEKLGIDEIRKRRADADV